MFHLFKKSQGNIYHCCIQKSASQWIRQILADPRISKITNFKIHVPGKDFILSAKDRESLWEGFPVNTIVSPLYIRYDDFLKMPRPESYKAFWVMRDPRDLVVSRYFSMKYSHKILNPQQERERKFLNEAGMEEGINYFIDAVESRHAPLYSSLTSWLKSSDNPDVIICRYEDLTGEGQRQWFKKIFEHCGLEISDEKLSGLLETYRFEKLSRGRKQGVEDSASHYRKGIAGDWKNHFTPMNKERFKKVAGRLLVDLGYEKDNNW